MAKVVGAFLLIVAVCLVAYMGCGPRAGVAKDAALKKIDDLLGPLNVAQKKVEMAYEELKTDSANVRDKRIEAQVRLKALTAKQEGYEQEKKKLVSDLDELKTMLTEAESSGSIKRGEREITVDQLTTIADGSIKKIKLLNEQLAKNKVITDAWAKNLDILKRQDETSQAQLAKLDGQLDLIRSKKSALDTMRQAATIAGPSSSISDKFNDLSAEVDELMVSIDTKWEIENVKLNERIADIEQDSDVTLEQLLGGDKTDAKSTISEIDKLLESEGTGK